MKEMLLALAVFLSCVAGASAQVDAEQPQPEDRGLIFDCLGQGGAPERAADRACIGRVESHCAEQEAQHYGDARSLVRCVWRERVAWEGLRDEFATALRAREDPEQIAGLDAALAEAQRWMEARCAYEESFSRGEMERINAATCMRAEAAETALMLHWRLREWSNY